MEEKTEVKKPIDRLDVENEALYVREENLLALIRNADFVETIFHFWLHKKPSENEKKMLNAVLVSFCGGFNITVPVILSARMAATTRAPIAQCLAAGFCSGGPAHTSAIAEIMKVYHSVEVEGIEAYVEEMGKKKQRIPGFGHPIFKRDPRPPVLKQLCKDLGVAGKNIEKFERIEKMLWEKKGIYGNIDGINGAVLSDLGFDDPSYGPALFLLSRSLAMTAHVIEEYGNKPFAAIGPVLSGYRALEPNPKKGSGDEILF